MRTKPLGLFTRTPSPPREEQGKAPSQRTLLEVGRLELMRSLQLLNQSHDLLWRHRSRKASLWGNVLGGRGVRNQGVSLSLAGAFWITC